MDYERLNQMIADHPDIVDFAEFGHGTTDEYIEKAEALIGILFPESYKWWLRNYGGGEIGGDEIYSIYEGLPVDVGALDIVRMFQFDDLAKGRIPICTCDIDGAFYLDPAVQITPGEYSVYSHALDDVYAPDFVAFLIKRIQLFLE